MEPFILYTRPSEKKNAKKSDDRWVAWFRDPISGARLPENRINIDTLNERLHGGFRVHITSKSEAFRIAQESFGSLYFISSKDAAKSLNIPMDSTFDSKVLGQMVPFNHISPYHIRFISQVLLRNLT